MDTPRHSPSEQFQHSQDSMMDFIAYDDHDNNDDNHDDGGMSSDGNWKNNMNRTNGITRKKNKRRETKMIGNVNDSPSSSSDSIHAPLHVPLYQPLPVKEYVYEGTPQRTGSQKKGSRNKSGDDEELGDNFEQTPSSISSRTRKKWSNKSSYFLDDDSSTNSYSFPTEGHGNVLSPPSTKQRNNRASLYQYQEPMPDDDRNEEEDEHVHQGLRRTISMYSPSRPSILSRSLYSDSFDEDGVPTPPTKTATTTASTSGGTGSINAATNSASGAYGTARRQTIENTVDLLVSSDSEDEDDLLVYKTCIKYN